MASRRGGNERRRPRGDPGWYDKSMAAFADQEERIEIPKDKVGLVIGRKGSRLQEIREQTGVQIFIKDNRAHLRGTAEQRQKAKTIIEEVLNPNSNKKGRWHQGGFQIMRNLIVPQHIMGQVLGKGHENLRNIETKTGAALKAINNSFHIKNATKRQEKLAEREIKTLANHAMKFLQLGGRLRLVHVDTAQLEENHEFQLTPLPVSNASLGENTYKLTLLEDSPQSSSGQETCPGFTNTDRITEKVLKVLRKIHEEKREEVVQVDMYCRFGHAYINNVDEDELEKTFAPKEIKEKLETANKKSWKPVFKESVEEMEVAEIEKNLPPKAAKEDIRYDFTFYTPTCRDVRAKAWLMEADANEEEVLDAASSLSFSRSAPIPVKNVLTHVQSDEQGDTSNTPCFHICTQLHKRLRVDILIPSKGLDCRLSIRTSQNYVPRTPQDEEEDKILESYVMGMKIENGQLILPPASELQDGFDLFYQRRSLRKTYQYEVEGEQFSLTVCKDQARNVCPFDTDTRSIEEIPSKADIHLHCEEWDRVLEEGNWEPEEIVAKLPTFLQFLRTVQTTVKPRLTDEKDDKLS